MSYDTPEGPGGGQAMPPSGPYGTPAAPGDDLGNVTVVSIEPKRVKLRAQGTEFFIRLP